jgi:predicted dehydrogenase
MPRNVSIAIIGCGDAGRVHAQCLAGIPEAEIVACCDVDETRAVQFKNEFSLQYATSDTKRIFADDTIQTVYICTHHDSHLPLAVAACEARKDIFMEKPLALTMEECAAIANTVERSGVKFFMGFKMRFYPMVERAHAFIPSPRIIAAQMMDIRWPDDFWANDPYKGGGNVLSEGVHTFDMLAHLAHANPVRIYAEGGNFHHEKFRMIDGLTATIAFDNGAVASVTQGDLGHPALVSKLSFQMFDGEKSVHLYNRLKSGIFFDGEQSETITDKDEMGYKEENRVWIRCLQMGLPSPCNAIDGWRATMLVQKAFTAVHTHRPQDIEKL